MKKQASESPPPALCAVTGCKRRPTAQPTCYSCRRAGKARVVKLTYFPECLPPIDREALVKQSCAALALARQVLA